MKEIIDSKPFWLMSIGAGLLGAIVVFADVAHKNGVSAEEFIFHRLVVSLAVIACIAICFARKQLFSYSKEAHVSFMVKGIALFYAPMLLYVVSLRHLDVAMSIIVLFTASTITGVYFKYKKKLLHKPIMFVILSLMGMNWAFVAVHDPNIIANLKNSNDIVVGVVCSMLSGFLYGSLAALLGSGNDDVEKGWTDTWCEVCWLFVYATIFAFLWMVVSNNDFSVTIIDGKTMFFSGVLTLVPYLCFYLAAHTTPIGNKIDESIAGISLTVECLTAAALSHFWLGQLLSLPAWIILGALSLLIYLSESTLKEIDT